MRKDSCLIKKVKMVIESESSGEELDEGASVTRRRDGATEGRHEDRGSRKRGRGSQSSDEESEQQEKRARSVPVI